MRRQHKQEDAVVVPTPVHWFPYTSNGNDIIGSLTPVSGSPTYSDDGVAFTANSSQKLRYNNVPLSDFTTIAMDVRFSVSTGLRQFLKLYYSNTQQYGAIASWDWSAVQYQFWNGSSTANSFSDPSSNYTVGVWYKVVMRTGTNSTDIFVNGTLRGSLEATYSQNYNHTMYVGGREISGREFYGNVRDLKMWDVALTSEQIAAL